MEPTARNRTWLPRLSTWLRRFLLATAGLSVGLVLTEIVLRRYFPLSSPNGRTMNLRHIVPGISPKTEYRVDERHIRTRGLWSEPKQPGVIRVLCVGASTTDQAFQSFSDTWYGLTEARATKELGLQVEFGGHGVGGVTSAQLLGWLKCNLDAVQPDMLITLEGVNDLVWRGGPEYRYEGVPRETPYDLSTSPHCSTELGNHCRMLQAQLEKRLNIANGQALEWHSGNLPRIRLERQHLPRRDVLHRQQDPIVEFGDAMDAILSLASQRGIPLLVLGQPVFWKPNMAAEEEALLWFPVSSFEGQICLEPGVLFREMKRYNEVQRRCAERHGASYVELDECIPKTPEYYVDDCHFTDLASHRLSDSIFPAVKAQLLKISAQRKAH